MKGQDEGEQTKTKKTMKEMKKKIMKTKRGRGENRKAKEDT